VHTSQQRCTPRAAGAHRVSSARAPWDVHERSRCARAHRTSAVHSACPLHGLREVCTGGRTGGRPVLRTE